MEANMGMSNSCSHAKVSRKRVPEHLTRDFGITLSLVNAVDQEVCEECGKTLRINIPNPVGLVAAAAIYRVKLPQKLTGGEIRFVRKALKWSAKKLAEVLDASAESVSRWENDKLVMGPSMEKLFRILTGISLADRAPAISFDPEEVIDMKINAVRNPEHELVLALELVRFKIPEVKVPADAYLEAA